VFKLDVFAQVILQNVNTSALSKKVYFCTPMKLFDIVLLSLGVVFIIIGAYEVMAVGLGQAYSSLMLAMIMFFWFTYRKKSKA
jgi:hypothetical protein